MYNKCVNCYNRYHYSFSGLKPGFDRPEEGTRENRTCVFSLKA